MADRLNRQTVVQVGLTVALVAVLGTVFLVRPRPLGESWDGLAALAHRPSGAGDVEGEAQQKSLEILRTLPAYIDVSLSLAALNAAREGLLKAVADRDVEAEHSAAAHYQWTLDCVRADLEKLEDFVDPRDFRLCLQDLFTVRMELGPIGPTIPESRLGILPQVSLLAPEDFP